jgi:hypothetical protein
VLLLARHLDFNVYWGHFIPDKMQLAGILLAWVRALFKLLPDF